MLDGTDFQLKETLLRFLGGHALSRGSGERPTLVTAREVISPFFAEAGITGSEGWVRFSSQCAMCVCGAASAC